MAWFCMSSLKIAHLCIVNQWYMVCKQGRGWMDDWLIVNPWDYEPSMCQCIIVAQGSSYLFRVGHQIYIAQKFWFDSLSTIHTIAKFSNENEILLNWILLGYPTAYPRTDDLLTSSWNFIGWKMFFWSGAPLWIALSVCL